MKRREHLKALNRFGAIGVSALSFATPRDSHKTAYSWEYDIVEEKGWYGIVWRNTNLVNGVPVAILIQVGHATRGSGYVQGRDFINPVIRPIFDRIIDDMWKEVTK